MLLGRHERGFDLLVVHNVELLDEQLLGAILVLQVCKDFGFAESRDDPFAACEDSFDETLSEAGRSPGDYEKTAISMGGRSEHRQKNLPSQTLVFAKVIGEAGAGEKFQCLRG